VFYPYGLFCLTFFCTCRIVASFTRPHTNYPGGYSFQSTFMNGGWAPLQLLFLFGSGAFLTLRSGPFARGYFRWFFGMTPKACPFCLSIGAVAPMLALDPDFPPFNFYYFFFPFFRLARLGDDTAAASFFAFKPASYITLAYCSLPSDPFFNGVPFLRNFTLAVCFDKDLPGYPFSSPVEQERVPLFDPNI